MKPLVVCLLVAFSFTGVAQTDSVRIKKYRLALPDQWMGKESVLDQLLAIAPSVFPSLNNAQFCLKCKTPYTLIFFYDSLVVDSRVAVFRNTSTEYRFGRQQQISKYECLITYHFKGTWALLYKDSSIAELELISPSEKVIATKKFSMKDNHVMLSSLMKRPKKVEYDLIDDPAQFVNKYPESFDPTVDDILKVIIDRIKQIKPE